MSLLFLLSLLSAHAHNNLFLPGDAFFSTTLSAPLVRSWKSGARDLDYFRHTYQGMFCGYAGYRVLVLDELTPSMLTNLEQVYQLVAANEQLTSLQRTSERDESMSPLITGGPEAGMAGSAAVARPGAITGRQLKLEKETARTKAPASVPMFVYNRSQDVTDIHLGLKYNESIAADTTASGHSEVVLDPYVHDPRLHAAISLDQHRSVLPLSYDRASAPSIDDPGGVDEPVHMRALDAQFVVLEGYDITAFGQRRDGLRFYVVTDEIRHYEYRSGKADQIPVRAETAAP